ncbi:MAG: hypothetical protein ABRQ27_15980 [Clostridiaceae bacterium]
MKFFKGVTIVGSYDTGEPEDFKFSEKNILNIQGSDFIPLYYIDDHRRKDLPSVRLYKSGKIKSLSLQELSRVPTKYGEYEVEKIIFYENGGFKRLFPLDGKISGYWTEEDEKCLAKEYTFKFPFGDIEGKFISMHFYDTQELKSLTLWPKEIVEVNHGGKRIKSRIGISLYKSGKLRSCEPNASTLIKTPIGEIDAYDKNAIGVHGEDNSLKFYEDGSIKSLITSTNIIRIKDKEGEETIHSPREERLFVNSDIPDIITMHVEFKGDKVVVDGEYEYDLNENSFKIDYLGGRKLLLF